MTTCLRALLVAAMLGLGHYSVAQDVSPHQAAATVAYNSSVVELFVAYRTTLNDPRYWAALAEFADAPADVSAPLRRGQDALASMKKSLDRIDDREAALPEPPANYFAREYAVELRQQLRTLAVLSDDNLKMYRVLLEAASHNDGDEYTAVLHSLSENEAVVLEMEANLSLTKRRLVSSNDPSSNLLAALAFGNRVEIAGISMARELESPEALTRLVDVIKENLSLLNAALTDGDVSAEHYCVKRLAERYLLAFRAYCVDLKAALAVDRELSAALAKYLPIAQAAADGRIAGFAASYNAVAQDVGRLRDMRVEIGSRRYKSGAALAEALR